MPAPDHGGPAAPCFRYVHAKLSEEEERIKRCVRHPSGSASLGSSLHWSGIYWLCPYITIGWVKKQPGNQLLATPTFT